MAREEIAGREGGSGVVMRLSRLVCGSDLVVAVEVTFLWRGSPWMHDCVRKGIASGKRSTLTPSGNVSASPDRHQVSPMPHRSMSNIMDSTPL